MRSRLPARLALLAAPLLLLGADDAPPSFQPWEVGGAQIQLSRVIMLAERISKQNLLYQLHLAEVRKEDLVRTAEEIDKALRVLHEGSGTLGVPRPRTAALREQIDRVDREWGKIRPMALASPYDYARRSGTSVGRTDDPLLVRHFERLVSGLIEQAVATQDLYFALCEQNSIPSCNAMRAAPATTALSERLLKETVFVHADIDPKPYRKRVEQTRGELAKAVERRQGIAIVARAQSPERGTAGRVVTQMRSDIDTYWETLDAQVTRLLAEGADEFDLMRALDTQQRLVFEYQRFTVAIIRFAAEQRARRAAVSAP